MGLLTDGITQAMEAWRKLWGEALKLFLKEPIRMGVEGVLEAIGNEAKDWMSPLLDDIEASPDLSPNLKLFLQTFRKEQGELAGILGASAGGGAVGGLISSTIGPWLLLAQYTMQRGANQVRFDPSLAMTLLFRDPGNRDTITSDLRDLGWKKERIDLLEDAAKPLLDISTLRQLWFRFPLTRDVIKSVLGQHGYSLTDIAFLTSTWPFMPSPQDVVMWAAREVFEEDAVRKYQLDAEFGNLDLTLFEKTGMSPDQAKNYWRAHWQHASWGQVQEMMFRTDFTEQDARDWFRLVEIPPYWRDKLIETAYHPLTRVDVRRMWRIGVLDTRDKLIRRYKDVGYNDENAGLMADFTIKYESEASRDLTRADVEDGYRKGLFSLSEATDALQELGYGPDEADYYLARQDYKSETALIDQYASRYRKLFVKGLVDDTTVRVELGARGATPAQIDQYLDLWELERGDDLVDETVTQRDLTRSDITRAYREGLLVRDEASGYLQLLGYDVDEAALYLDLEDLAREKAKKDLTLATYKALYVAGTLNKTETTARLAAQGFEAPEIELLYTLWDIERDGTIRLPTKAELVRFLKKGIIGEERYAQELVKQGYGAEYISWYVRDTRE